MTSRDLFLKVLNFENSDRTLKWEFGYWGGAIEKWYKEGLPKKLGFNKKLAYGEIILGPGFQYPMPSYDDNVLNEYDVSLYFNFDKAPAPLPFNWLYCPKFEYQIINETEDTFDYIDECGIKCRNFKDLKSMPMWLEHPVKNESDWEELVRDRLNLDNFSERYNLNNYSKRYGESYDNVEEFISKAKDRDYPICIYGSPIGFFGILRLLIGEENLYYWYYDKPDLLKKMLDYLCNFWLSIAEELISKIDFDYGRFWEDMAYKGSSLISPSLFREFMTPYYKKLIDFAKSKGIKHFIVDSDGYMEDLIPLFMEVGMTAILPFDILAGNDIERVRKKYPNFGILGGINKYALLKKESIDNELEKAKRLIEKGGFVPCVDHLVPPDVSWENFKYYRRKLNDMIDMVKVKPKKFGS